MAIEMTPQIEEQIRTRAYFLWEADGCPQGRDWEYWMKAQQERENQATPSAAVAPAPARKKSAAIEPRVVTPSSPKRRNNNRAAVLA